MTFLSIEKVRERNLWLAVCFCTVYQSYRYPLQMNSSGTSPTYSDTPMMFQLTKSIVVLLLCVISIVCTPRRFLPFRKWVLAGLVTCMSFYPLFKALFDESGDKASCLDVAFWPLAALILALSARMVTVEALDRYFRFLFFYAIASTAIEVFLFLTIGRLPALAYSESFVVRFGGFLDDPNGFPVLLYMLMGWAYYRHSGAKRLLAEGALVICILLSQSLTAIGFLLLLAILFMANYFVRRSKLLLIAGGATLSIILGLVWSPMVTIISTVMEVRSASVNSHLSQVTSTKPLSAVDWLFGGISYQDYESWWFGSLVNFGILWYLLSMGIVAALMISTFRMFRHASKVKHKAVMCGLLMLSCDFVIGNLNLPLYKIFPVNFLFFFFSFLIVFARIGEEDSQGGAFALSPSYTLLNPPDIGMESHLPKTTLHG